MLLVIFVPRRKHGQRNCTTLRGRAKADGADSTMARLRRHHVAGVVARRDRTRAAVHSLAARAASMAADLIADDAAYGAAAHRTADIAGYRSARRRADACADHRVFFTRRHPAAASE